MTGLRVSRCYACYGYLPTCGLCFGTDAIVTQDGRPEPEPDLRLALSDAYKDLADQALARGDREAHGIWNQAAAMAHDFVLRKRT